MKFLAIVTVTSLGLALGAIAVATALGAVSVAGPVLGGMFGPWIAVVATWVVVVHTQVERPAAVQGVMMAAFVVKALFFAVYAVAMVKVFELDVRAFGLSFAGFFIVLYGLEAAFFVRLFRGPLEGARP